MIEEAEESEVLIYKTCMLTPLLFLLQPGLFNFTDVDLIISKVYMKWTVQHACMLVGFLC